MESTHKNTDNGFPAKLQLLGAFIACLGTLGLFVGRYGPTELLDVFQEQVKARVVLSPTMDPEIFASWLGELFLYQSEYL